MCHTSRKKPKYHHGSIYSTPNTHLTLSANESKHSKLKDVWVSEGETNSKMDRECVGLMLSIFTKEDTSFSYLVYAGATQ